eukprot:240279-Pyramimonas_sp.AAC.1
MNEFGNYDVLTQHMLSKRHVGAILEPSWRHVGGPVEALWMPFWRLGGLVEAFWKPFGGLLDADTSNLASHVDMHRVMHARVRVIPRHFEGSVEGFCFKELSDTPPAKAVKRKTKPLKALKW